MSKHTHKYSALVIGGSAGSIKVIKQILKGITFTPTVPIVVVLHRLQSDKNSKLQEVIQYSSRLAILEPKHNEKLQGSKVYLAPVDYHLVITEAHTFELSSSPLVHYSRPSIDVLFCSAADIYKEKVAGILLTGANRDGAMGIKTIKEKEGLTIVQDPQDSFVSTMPQAALRLTKVDHVLSTEKIVELLNTHAHLF